MPYGCPVMAVGAGHRDRLFTCEMAAVSIPGYRHCEPQAPTLIVATAQQRNFSIS